jgi:hypothetical protein
VTDNPRSRVILMKRILRDMSDLYLITELELKRIQTDFVKIKEKLKKIDLERALSTKRIQKEIDNCIEGIQAEFRDDINKLEKNDKKV